MIDILDPDYTNTPASNKRPARLYVPLESIAPVVSIITPYYNTGQVFMETVRSIQRMSFPYWEWIIVDDGSTKTESLMQLAHVQALEPRVRVIHQPNSGPAAARNRAAREARGRYLFQLDSDDLVEPTMVEKALWVLETQPQFAVCNSFTVTFGSHNYLWSHGFQEYERSLQENVVTNQGVIRRDAFLEVGGYDETIVRGHEDWDLWLNMAEAGHWGFTIPEYLTWYRRVEAQSRIAETEGDRKRARSFRAWLRRKHHGLVERFPHPLWVPSVDMPYASVSVELPFKNLLEKRQDTTRVLFVVPWLEIGGADKFNLDLVRVLSARGYEFTIVTTTPSSHPWLHEFASVTPDIFCLNHFLHYNDYPRFLNYLIQSRQIDAVLISNSELAYMLLPFLRAYHPHLALLDYNHLEEEHWKNGGYPGMSVRAGRQLDLNVTCTAHLKNWMVKRGADPERIRVCHANIDTQEWNRERYDTEAIRKQLKLDPETALILFVGRIVDQKRPLVFAEIIKRLALEEPHFVALVIGVGELLAPLQSFIKKHKLEQHVRFMGALPNKDVRKLMAVGDILLLPSASEGLALVVYESMAMSMVPVAADVGGHSELVTPECGYLIPHGKDEVDGYVAALTHLVRHPRERRLMGLCAQKRVRDHFDLSNLSEGMHQIFCEAQRLAASRDDSSLDRVTANHVAHMVVESVRLAELAEVLWATRRTTGAGSGLRRARERVLPIGTGRYEVYKAFRQALRLPKRALRWLQRRLKARAGGPPLQPPLSPPEQPIPKQQTQEVVQTAPLGQSG